MNYKIVDIMKTVAVSRSTAYRCVCSVREQMNSSEQFTHFEKVGNSITFDDFVFYNVVAMLGSPAEDQGNNKSIASQNNSSDIEFLQMQIIEKDKQIANLQKALDQQQQLNALQLDTINKLQLKQAEPVQPVEHTEIKKKTIFDIFRKGK